MRVLRPLLEWGAVVLLAFGVGGCATNSRSDGQVMRAGDVVAVVNIAGNEVSHFHIGTTAFNNYDHRVPARSDFASLISQELVNAIQGRTGYRAVVAPLTPALSSGEPLIKRLSGKVNPTMAPDLRAIAARLNAKLIVVAASADESPLQNGPPVRGYGLLTRSFMGLDRAIVYSNIRYYRLTPDLELMTPFNSFGNASGAIDIDDVEPVPAKDQDLPAPVHQTLARELPGLFRKRIVDAVSLIQ